MHLENITLAQLRVTAARANGASVPGWVAEVAMLDFDNIPSCTLAEFRRQLPSTVPEIAVLSPWETRKWWQFWRKRIKLTDDFTC